MRRSLLVFVSILALAIGLTAQTPAKSASVFTFSDYGIKIEPDKRLMVVMAALEAAGTKTQLTETGEQFRQTVRADIANLDPNLRSRMVGFVESYKQRHPSSSAAEMTASFVSLAYALGPLPDLAEPARSGDLPAELLEVLDFAPMLREFYKASGISAKLPAYTAEYQKEVERFRGPAKNMVISLTDYLHTRPELFQVESRKTMVPDPKNKNKKIEQVVRNVKERRFYLVPELLAPAGTINFRNIGDDYFAVIPPNTDLSVSETRRAYLQFILDPLVLKYARDIAPFKDGIKSLLDELKNYLFELQKQKDPNVKLDDIYVSPDIYLAVARSVVAAADAKETEFQRIQLATYQARAKIDAAKGEQAKRAVSAELDEAKKAFADDAALELSESYERGAVLAFYFADQFVGLQDSGFDISSSLREMILSMDPAKQAGKIKTFADGRQRALKRRATQNKALVDKIAVMKPVLDEVEILIKAKNFPDAEAKLRKLLESYPGESRIYYGLGRISSFLAESAFDEGLRDKRLDDARVHFSNALRTATTATDPALIQLCYVSLARIYEFNEENDFALKIYEKALTYGKADEGAYNEALKAVDKLKKPQP